MAQLKATRSKVDIEDKVLQRVLQVTLRPGDDRGGSGVPLYLEQLAAELLSEDRPTVLSRDSIERVFMERLSTIYAGYDPPFSYLVGCYRRALEEARKAQIMKDKIILAEILDALQQVKELAVSYAVLVLAHAEDINFPQSPEPSLAPNMQFLALILGDLSPNMGYDTFASSGSTLPPGFLDDLINRFENEPEGLKNVFEQLFKDLQGSVMKISPLGPFQGYLRALGMLVSHPSLALVLVHHPMWNPRGNHVNGRVLEVSSILGPFFHISVIPDHPVFGNGEPNVGQQCFSEASTRRTSDLTSSYALIKTVMHQLYDGLHDVILKLLKTAEAREKVLQYLADVIQKNANRVQMQVFPYSDSCQVSTPLFSFLA
jgi:ubiquitin conjugation factor E4 B